MPTVLITGGTGLIGTHLTTLLLSRGFNVTVLTRQKRHTVHHGSLSFAFWDPAKGLIDRNAIAATEFIIHLAGANVGERRWTPGRKKEIVDSRVKSGALLVKALRETPNQVKAVLTASGIGWYGPDTSASRQNGFHEDVDAAANFLGETCRLWENALEPVRSLGKRLVIFRQGIVLSNDGGAFVEFKKPLKFGIAAVLGNGEQVISWIHIDDLCRIYCFALEKELDGIYNAVAPEPVSNRDFTLELARRTKGRAFISVRVPSFVLKAVLGELSIEVLKSATVSCEKIRAAGFEFKFPTVGATLDSLTRSQKSAR